MQQTGLPTLESYLNAAKGTDIVALCTAIPFDHETPVTLADRFVDQQYFYLLESASSGPNARYSFIGFDPLWILSQEAGGGHPCHIARGSQVTASGEHSAIHALAKEVKSTRYRWVWPEGMRHAGPDVAAMAGPCGFFGYEVSQDLEPSIGPCPPGRLGLPRAFFFVPGNALVMDHVSRKLFVCRLTVPGDNPEAAYQGGIRDLKALLRKLESVHSPPPLRTTDAEADFERCESSFPQEKFFRAAERCLEEVRAGEIFQIQIGNRLSVKTEARPFDIFRHLRTLNPSPYMFFYRFGRHHILGASPEMMVGLNGRVMTHRPIAGTRKRTYDPLRDQQMRHELVTSEKERAEHVMLVDLSRNDIGRLAVPGTVKVEELMVVEEYSHVFHMVSQVSGMLGEGSDAFDAMAVSFPNGTVSGAPKIRAMQLINAIEPVGREFYAGSLAMFDFTGNLRSTILIRTIHVADGVASTQASAGIVYDSVPEQEWLETRNKMRACLLAMQNTL